MRYYVNVSIEGLPFYSIIGETGLVVAMRVTDEKLGKRIAKLLEADDEKQKDRPQSAYRAKTLHKRVR